MPKPSKTAMPSLESITAALPPSRFRHVARPTAFAILLTVVVAMVALLAIAHSYRPPPGATSVDQGDMALYDRIVERMRAGEGYYTVAHDELVAGGYGTRSVFNWRPPALPWLASRLPNAFTADLVLRLIAIAAAVATYAAIRTVAGPPTAVLALLALMVNLTTAAAPSASVFADIVVGVLILASVAAYGLSRPLIGMLIALSALFMRELVAPFVCVCVFLAWQERRRTELLAWAAGLLIFAGSFARHAVMVHAQIGPNDVAYDSGWVQFGGLSFILATAQANGLLIVAPIWQSAILLPLCLLGLAGWRGPLGERVGLTIAAYILFFAFVGKSFNSYWGELYTPLIMLGLAFLPAALRDLIQAVGARQPAKA